MSHPSSWAGHVLKVRRVWRRRSRDIRPIFRRGGLGTARPGGVTMVSCRGRFNIDPSSSVSEPCGVRDDARDYNSLAATDLLIDPHGCRLTSARS